MTIRRGILLALVLFLHQASVQAGEFPRALGNGRHCGTALEMARAVFDSSSEYLYDKVSVAEDLSSTLIPGPGQADMAGSEFFDKLPIRTGGFLYWQKETHYGQRIVVKTVTHSWRGDWFWLFSLDAAVSEQTAQTSVDIENRAVGKRAAVSESWQAPLLLRDKRNGEVWAVDPGQPFVILGDWSVYALSTAGLRQQCRIKFKQDGRYALDILPAAVRTLARLLDQTMGPGLDEGTLQATARIRLQVRHTFANVAWRPWVQFSPYNDRKTADANLLAWSKVNRKRKKLYDLIQVQYPLAEKALAVYYRKAFAYPTEKAEAMAASALDAAFRSHFVFSVSR